MPSVSGCMWLSCANGMGWPMGWRGWSPRCLPPPPPPMAGLVASTHLGSHVRRSIGCTEVVVLMAVVDGIKRAELGRRRCWQLGRRAAAVDRECWRKSQRGSAGIRPWRSAGADWQAPPNGSSFSGAAITTSTCLVTAKDDMVRLVDNKTTSSTTA